MRIVTRLLALVGLVLLAACTKPVHNAAESEVAAARYQAGEPYEIVLFNVVNNERGSGEHSALMINAPSQRVLFDPAGSWTHPLSPEVNDVHYGFDDNQLFRYTYYHARRTHHVRIQHLQVARPLADTGLPDPALLSAVAVTLLVGVWRKNAIWAMLAGAATLAAVTLLT